VLHRAGKKREKMVDLSRGITSGAFLVSAKVPDVATHMRAPHLEEPKRSEGRGLIEQSRFRGTLEVVDRRWQKN